jgi:hypothetical protein
VDYLDKGKVSSDVVRKELREYFDRGPIVKWNVTGLIQSPLEAGSNYKITFPITFEVNNPATKKRVAGTAIETEMLAPDASGNKKIISQHEKIAISHRSDGKPAKTEREKVYRGRPTGPGATVASKHPVALIVTKIFLFSKFQPSRVTITTNDGKEYSTRVDVPKGDPRDPMTEEEIAVKFTALGGDVIGKKQCETLRQFIMNLENAGKLDDLVALTVAR